MNSVSTFTMVFALIVMLIAFVGTIVRIKKNKGSDLVDWFILSIGAYNGIGIVLIILELQKSQYRRGFSSIISNNSDIWMYPILCLLAIFFVWCGAVLSRKNEIEKLRKNSEENELYKKTYSKTVFRIAWMFSIVGMLCYWLYVRPYGGFVTYLDYARAIRAGLFDEVNVDRTWSFLKRFGGFSYFATLLFAGLILTYRSPFFLWVSFFISFSFSLYVLYTWGGRLGMLVFLTSLIVGRYLFKYGNGFKFLFSMIIPLMLILIILPSSSKIWGIKKGGIDSSQVAKFFVHEISYPLSVFVKANEANEPRWMQDILFAPAYIFPERIWRGVLKMDTVSQISTERVVGVRKGVRRSTKGVPVDFISFGIMEGGIIGVVLISLFYGFFLTKIEKWMFVYCRSGVREILYGYLIFTLPIQTVLYSDPKHIIVRNFHFIVGFFVLRYCERKAIKRRK